MRLPYKISKTKRRVKRLASLLPFYGRYVRQLAKCTSLESDPRAALLPYSVRHHDERYGGVGHKVRGIAAVTIDFEPDAQGWHEGKQHPGGQHHARGTCPHGHEACEYREDELHQEDMAGQLAWAHGGDVAIFSTS